MAVTPSQITYLSPGSLTETASYIIWVEGSNYFSKDGTTGQITSSTVASTLIQDCIGSGGKTLFFKLGTYQITNTIYPKNQTKFWGESTRNYDYTGIASTLKVANSSLTELINIADPIWGVEFESIWLDGNNKAGSSIEGITSTGISIYLHNVKIYNFSGNGILGYGTDIASGLFQIINCEIGYNGETGINGAYGWADNFITDCNINANGHYGIELGAGSGAIIRGGHIEWNEWNGIRVTSVTGVNIQGVRFDRNKRVGVALIACNNSIVSGNYFYRNGELDPTPDNEAHILNQGSNGTIITSNTFLVDWETGTYPEFCITTWGSYDVTIANNDLSNGCASTTQQIHFWSMSDFNLHHNTGFITENSGTTSGTNGFTVNHGISVTPTYALICPKDTYAGNFTVYIGATALTIYFDGGGTKEFYWIAGYEVD